MLLDFLKKIIGPKHEGKDQATQANPKMNFLIVGLGNIGPEYARTRHNIGFMVVDALADAASVAFEDKR